MPRTPLALQAETETIEVLAPPPVHPPPDATGAPEAAAESYAERLAELCQGGCQEAFSRLVDLLHARIFNFLVQISGNREDAEDLTQETFVRAFRGMDRYTPGRPFAPWIFTIARRAACSHYRSKRMFEPLPDEPSLLPSHNETPATLLVRQDDATSLWALARRLKPKQFEALWLRYAEDLSVSEVAGVMQTNSLHVRVLLHRARLELERLRRGPCPSKRNF